MRFRSILLIAAPVVLLPATLTTAQVSVQTSQVVFDQLVSNAGMQPTVFWNLNPNTSGVNAATVLNPPLDLTTHALNVNDPWTSGATDLWPAALDHVRFMSNLNPGTGVLIPGGLSTLAFATPFALPDITADFLGENTVGAIGSLSIILTAPVNNPPNAVALEIQGIGGSPIQAFVISVFDENNVFLQNFGVAGTAGLQTFAGVVRLDGPIGRIDVWDTNFSFEGITSIETFHPMPIECMVFDAAAEFEAFNIQAGHLIDSVEVFDPPVSNVPDEVVALVSDPLVFGIENVDGNGFGFPQGLSAAPLLMQSNSLGALAPQTRPGDSLAAYGTGSLSSCPWDCDGDGVVNITDLLDLLALWGACVDCCRDFDSDGIVGITDLLDLLANWGMCSIDVAPSSVAMASTVLAHSMDMILISPADDHIAISFAVSDPTAQPGGTFEILLVAPGLVVLDTISLPASVEPQFVGVTCSAGLIRRINVAALTPKGQPSREVIDDVLIWRSGP